MATPTMTMPRKPLAPAGSGRLAWVIVWLCRLYVAALVVLCAVLWTCADVWWPATVLMYLPRWVFGLPLLVLVPAALVLRRRALRWLLVGAFLWVWPFMGLCLPWRQVLAGEPAGPVVRVLTCNTHYRQLDPAALRQFLDETRPDVLAFQYWEGHAEPALFESKTVHPAGEFLIASRWPIRDEQHLTRRPLAVSCVLDAPFGRVQFVTLHLATPRDGLLAVVKRGDGGIVELEANIERRRAESEQITGWLRDVNEPLIIVGDFNTTVESDIFRTFWAKYTDAFSVAGCGWGPTQITPKRTAARIDHILVGSGWRCRNCWVGPFVGSEHRPVVADLEWVGDR
jgi:endonuclease/exonuclease/phosphatase (EEP) superfamily protein YafD